MYVVCQKSGCQQTYPVSLFTDKEQKNVPCEKCGGVLIDGEGRGNVSRNATVIPVITSADLKAQRERSLERKKEELKQKRKDARTLAKEIKALERDED